MRDADTPECLVSANGHVRPMRRNIRVLHNFSIFLLQSDHEDPKSQERGNYTKPATKSLDSRISRNHYSHAYHFGRTLVGSVAWVHHEAAEYVLATRQSLDHPRTDRTVSVDVGRERLCHHLCGERLSKKGAGYFRMEETSEYVVACNTRRRYSYIGEDTSADRKGTTLITDSLEIVQISRIATL